MDIVLKVENSLRDGTLQNNPHECAILKSELASISSTNLEELGAIHRRKPIVWLEMRKSYKSDKATDRSYDATADGQEGMRLEVLKLRISKLMSGLSALLEDAKSESFNQY